MASYYDQHARQLKRDLAAEVPTEALRELHRKRPLLHATVATANVLALVLAGIAVVHFQRWYLWLPFALVYQKQTDAGKAKALVNFLSWALTTGQNFPATVNYAPMGKILQQKALSQLNKITLGGKPLVKIPISFK